MDAIVSQIVDRLHVGTSNLGVIRAVRRGLEARYRRDPRYREGRKMLYRYAIAKHRTNRDEYAFVMGGIG